MHIVLVEPEIPQNTGNIARSCAATGSPLHLVGELGFSLEDRYLKRAGLDYWPMVRLSRYQSLEEAIAGRNFYLASTHGGRNYADVAYGPEDCLVFGRESQGLPHELLQRFPDRVIRIPMLPGTRSLNLSNSVAVILFEALRQQGFQGMDPALGAPPVPPRFDTP